MQIIIPKYIQGTDTGTLSGIAKQYGTDIPTIQSLNPQITDINKIQEGANLNLPDLQKPAPVATGQNQAIVSSDLARNQFVKDTDNLTKAEGQFITPEVKPEIKPAEGQIVEKPTEKSITFTSTNPAFQSIINQTNETLNQFKAQGGTLSPENQDRLNQINTFQAQKETALANAREAADEKDAAKLSAEMTKAKEAETSQKLATETLRSELKTAREGRITALTPTQKEKELKTKLNTLRTDRQLLPLELRQQGISAAGIQSGQIEDERVRGIQEQNLLLEIGLEQDARKMKAATYEQQAKFIQEDIELQNKIDTQLREDARKVIEDARNLKKDSLSALSTILDKEKGFGGLAWEDMDAETQAELIDMAKTQNIPLKLLTSALKNVKQQKVFDNALKTTEEARKVAQEARLGKEKEEESIVDIRQRKQNLADLLGQVAGHADREEALTELNKYQGSILEKVGNEGMDKLKVEIDRLFPEKKEEEIGETTGLFGSFFKRLFGK